MSKKKDTTKKDTQQKERTARKELKQLQEDHENLQAERDALFEKLQRVSADYANYQKRVPKQVADSVSYEKEKILKSLLPALDNFEHALQNVEGADNVEAIVAGVRMVYEQMLDILGSHGVETIEAADQLFDPARHEAMLRQSDPEKEDNLVLQEFQKGYTLNGRVIRPSKVIVNKITPSPPEDEGEPSEASPDNATEETSDQEV